MWEELELLELTRTGEDSSGAGSRILSVSVEVEELEDKDPM